ncbi:MAG: OB-fold domain-containing protein [Acidimicrobiales bacterium]
MSTEAPAERIQPPTSPAALPFWEATREQRLVLQWCTACEQAIHFPREACPRCLGTALEFRPAAGTGTIYAASTMPVPGNAGMAGRAPYVVALVELPEGVRLMANVVGDGALGAAVGDVTSSRPGSRSPTAATCWCSPWPDRLPGRGRGLAQWFVPNGRPSPRTGA